MYNFNLGEEKKEVSNKKRLLYILILIVLLKAFDEVKPYETRNIDEFKSYEIIYFLIEMFFMFILVLNVLSITWNLFKRSFAYTDTKYEIMNKYRKYQKERYDKKERK